MQQQGPDAAEEPKLQVDEDWKKTVAEEKKSQRGGQQAAPKAAGRAQSPPLPKPSVHIFMAGLYTQTLVLLGQLPNPATGEASPDLGEAAYLIDTISMLREKMQGNLTADEGSYVDGILYDLRMRYVSATSASAQAADAEKTAQS